jgi:hypothetical protein
MATWNGYGISPLEHPVLRGMIVGALGPELRALERAVIVPLGKANEAVKHLCHHGHLDSSRCIIGFPHPSPPSPRRHQIFAARRHTLERQVDRLRSSTASPSRLVRAAASALQPTTAPVNGEVIRIELMHGNVRNGQFYLRRHLAFFPADAVGPANRADGTGNPLRVWFAGDPEAATTDIAGGNKLMFRCRARVAAFFRRHRLAGGDAVLVRRIGPREYEVRPQFA